MAEIQAAILCDFAQVREGMLFVSSGVVTRISCEQIPRPISLGLALVIEVGPEEIERVHEVRVNVSRDGGTQPIGMAVLGFQAQPPPLHPGEALPVPLALPLGPMMIETLGPYDVRVSVDDQVPKILTFYAVLPPEPTASQQ